METYCEACTRGKDDVFILYPPIKALVFVLVFSFRCGRETEQSGDERTRKMANIPFLLGSFGDSSSNNSVSNAHFFFSLLILRHGKECCKWK
ncbi:hypothetical protein CEXT_648241 [Caerostris extrusa]|uniref:Uncharacterized protein n=1 Tax=Caerostris extrusa TaxID=172846 RepID=A0AAV4X9S2_CAEEX|nr:hypothetical protein CEXT_648241 [Caerostris extrusa]